jgi:hypothetical protein
VEGEVEEGLGLERDGRRGDRRSGRRGIRRGGRRGGGRGGRGGGGRGIRRGGRRGGGRGESSCHLQCDKAILIEIQCNRVLYNINTMKHHARQ